MTVDLFEQIVNDWNANYRAQLCADPDPSPEVSVCDSLTSWPRPVSSP